MSTENADIRVTQLVDSLVNSLLTYQSDIAEVESKYNDTLTSAKTKYNQAVYVAEEVASLQQDKVEQEYQRINSLINKWDSYIDAVHRSFSEKIDKARKNATNKTRSKYLELTEQIKELSSDIRRDNEVECEQKPIVSTALSYALNNMPVWARVLNVIFVIASIMGVIAIIVSAMSGAYYHHSANYYLHSNLIHIFLYVSIGWLVALFIFSFIQGIRFVKSLNNAYIGWAYEENDQLKKELQTIKLLLKNLEKEYTGIFYINGKWIFDSRRYHISAENANQLLQEAIKEQNRLRPSASRFVSSDYTFQINYNAI